MMLTAVAVTVVPAVAAECDPNEEPCGLQQPPNCGPILPGPGGYVDCQVGALSDPCDDGCGFIAYAVGNALYACGVVVRIVTDDEGCAP